MHRFFLGAILIIVCNPLLAQQWYSSGFPQMSGLYHDKFSNLRTQVCSDDGVFYLLAGGTIYRNQGGDWQKYRELDMTEPGYSPSLSVEGSTFLVTTPDSFYFITDNRVEPIAKPTGISTVSSGVLMGGRIYAKAHRIGSSSHFLMFSGDTGKTWTEKSSLQSNSFLYKISEQTVAVSVDSYQTFSRDLMYISDSTLYKIKVGVDELCMFPLSEDADGRIYSRIYNRITGQYSAAYYSRGSGSWTAIKRNLQNPFDEYPMAGAPTAIFANGNKVHLSWYTPGIGNSEYLSEGPGEGYRKLSVSEPGKWGYSEFYSFSDANALAFLKEEISKEYANLHTVISMDNGRNFKPASWLWHTYAGVTVSNGQTLYTVPAAGSMYTTDDLLNWTSIPVLAPSEKTELFDVLQHGNSALVVLQTAGLQNPGRSVLHCSQGKPLRYLTGMPVNDTDWLSGQLVKGDTILLLNETQKKIIVTKNGGANWQSVDIAIYYPPGYAGHKLTLTDNYLYLVTSDTIWRKKMDDANWVHFGRYSFPRIIFSGPGEFLLVTANRLYRVGDSGVLQEGTVFPARESFSELHSFSEEGRLVVVESGKEAITMHVSWDNAATWKSTLLKGVYPDVLSIAKLNDSYILSTRRNGIVVIPSAVVGIEEELVFTDHHVYPNPATESFYYNSSCLGIVVYDLQGRFIREYAGGSMEQRYPVDMLEPGTYLLRIRSVGRPAELTRLVIAR